MVLDVSKLTSVATFAFVKNNTSALEGETVLTWKPIWLSINDTLVYIRFESIVVVVVFGPKEGNVINERPNVMLVLVELARQQVRFVKILFTEASDKRL